MWVSRRRYYSRDTNDQLNKGMEWQTTFFYYSCRRCGSCSSPILFGSFGISNVRACWRRGQNNKAGCYVLPWRDSDCHPTIVLASAVFWPLTLNIRVVWLWVVEDVGCNVDRLMLQRSRMYSNPGYVEWSFSVTEVWWIWPRALEFGEGGMGERGSNSFFVKFEKFIYFEPRKSNLWLASSILSTFLLSAFHRPWHWCNALFPGRLNHR